MRAYGLYVHGPRGEEILLDPLRGRESNDHPELPLRASGVRRTRMTGYGMAAAGAANGSKRFELAD
jgi:hypothetical protein